MTRNTFLATITALFTAPFIGKAKEKRLPTAQDLIDLENSIAPSYRTKLKGEDLYIILDRSESRRKKLG